MGNLVNPDIGIEFLFILVISIVVLIVLLIAIFVTIKVRKKKRINIDEEYINELLKNLGGKANISVIGVDGRKLKVVVHDLSIVDLDKLKQLAQAGIFVSGNNIKALFKYDSVELNKGLKSVIKEK